MMERSEGKTGLVLAAIGGGALLLWWLGRGGGFGAGRHSGGTGGSGGSRVRVRARASDHVELDGVATDLPTAVRRAREVGKASVAVDGDAREGWFQSVVRALEAAGVEVALTSPNPKAG